MTITSTPSNPEQNPSDSKQPWGLVSLFYVTDYMVLVYKNIKASNSLIIKNLLKTYDYESFKLQKKKLIKRSSMIMIISHYFSI